MKKLTKEQEKFLETIKSDKERIAQKARFFRENQSKINNNGKHES